ncbi:ATP-binding protein [Streptomyces sp. NPDC001307]|uniref:ATP-binding protein n=1 Tax=Streptomyces sp. NPDC001307 TaxID=3364560 RepID=UPI0036AA1B81
MRGRALVAEDGSPVRSTSMPREAASVPAARQLVRETLADWGLPDVADAAELVVSELASNAVRHACHGAFRLTIRRLAGGSVRVAVTDKSRTLPVLATASTVAVNGRGLALVDAVSRQWGTDLLPWGKRVWADVEPADDAVLADDHTRAVAHRVWTAPAAQITCVLIVVAMAAWLGVLIATGQRSLP